MNPIAIQAGQREPRSAEAIGRNPRTNNSNPSVASIAASMVGMAHRTLQESVRGSGRHRHSVDRDHGKDADEAPAEDQPVPDAMQTDERNRGPDNSIRFHLDERAFEDEPSDACTDGQTDERHGGGDRRISEPRVVEEDQ